LGNGDLLWYQHLGHLDGNATWENSGQGKKVGNGWNFKQVFGGADGVIYGVLGNGDLLWYQHLGHLDGNATWENSGQGKKVGNGWNFKQVFGGDDGVIYGVVT
jgi:hypothetical protein